MLCTELKPPLWVNAGYLEIRYRESRVELKRPILFIISLPNNRYKKAESRSYVFLQRRVRRMNIVE